MLIPWWSHQEQRAIAWIETQVRLLGARRRGPLLNEKASGFSYLFKIPTTGGTLYFKACRLLHTRQTRVIFSSEASLTQELARLFPQLLPPVIAIESEQQWMLLHEGGPLLLRDQATLTVWCHALSTFAHLQMASLVWKEDLLRRGCVDRNPAYLIQDFEDILKEKVIWSRIQASQVEYLRRSLPLLSLLCRRLAQLPLPVTLVHGDLHAGNIVLHDGLPAFLDWSDACLTHPFFDAITFWARTGALKQEKNVHQALQNAYLAPWHAYATPPQLAEAVELAEILGCVHQLVSYRTIVELEEPWKQQMLDGAAYWMKRLFAFLQQATSRLFL